MTARGSKIMGKSPKHLGISPKDQNSETQMSDVFQARELLQETFAITVGRNVKAAIGEAFDALHAHEKRLPKDVLKARERRWTARRVRAIWDKEARRIDHYEIQDLTAVAVEEARIERQRLKARELRLEAFLASQGEGVGSEEGQRGSGLAGGLDSAGVGGTDADENSDQSQGWGL
jgi:hypothetical protein